MIKQFVQFCLNNIENSFGQNFQDLFGLWVSGGARSGYFVEFGALNGREFSNTYLLEKLGWDGIVAEPHPSYEERVKNVRNCHFSTLCVFDVTGDTVKFRTVVGRPAMSGIAQTQLNDSKARLRENYREIDIKTITLDDLLDQYSAPDVVDFISVDTEGSELRILNAFDFARRHVKSFCIEHNYEQREELADLMTRNGYVQFFPELSAHDDWWVHRDDAGGLPSGSIKVSDHFSELFENGLESRRDTLLAKL